MMNITSFRGGLNVTDSPLAIGADQMTDAQNVDLVDADLVRRRHGSSLVSPPSAQSAVSAITLCRVVNGQLWLVGSNGGTPVLTLDGAVVTIPGTALADCWSIAHIGGKTFLTAGHSSGRPLVYDAAWSTSGVRPAGLEEPGPPTAADAGSGSLDGVRYYRVRLVNKSGAGQVRIQSEPSEALTFTPSGSGASVTVTRPAVSVLGATDWTIEASVDNVSFYVLATLPLATTTYSDAVDYTAGYINSGTLSEDIGDYTLLPSAAFVAVAEDRLILAGHRTDEALNSRVWWTPVTASPGVGNNERLEWDTTPFLDLDSTEGGGITGVAAEIAGTAHVFKRKAIYRLVRTGIRTRAFQAYALTKERGALKGSIVNAIDQTGAPLTLFVDAAVGPCVISNQGVREAGYDVLPLLRPYLSAASVRVRAIHYPNTRTVRWWFSADGLDPISVVLHLREMRLTPDGYRRGWTLHTGVAVADVTLDAATGRPLTAHTAADGLLRLNDDPTTVTDAGVAFVARAVSAPTASPNGITALGGVRRGLLTADAADTTVMVGLLGDFGVERRAVTVSLAPPTPEPSGASPDDVVVDIDNLALIDRRVVQLEITDPEGGPAAAWAINGFLGTAQGGQTS
jgi:hypothetical protein